jgi:ferredoxin--NADP+ reductase
MESASIHLQTDLDHSERFTATVASSVRLTPEAADEVREITLDLRQKGLHFAAGQSIGVVAPNRIRLYSIADTPAETADGLLRIKICVKRVGPVSGYLCDLEPGADVVITGPHGLPFTVPPDHSSNLILFCSSTGIAPFRAFVKHLYENVADWTGPVWLFLGASNPLETLYMNDECDDFVNYYDLDTFIAFKALGPNPSWPDSIPWDRALDERADDLLRHFANPNTHVYVAGLEGTRDALDKIFSERLGSIEEWRQRKGHLTATGRWVELLY